MCESDTKRKRGNGKERTGVVAVSDEQTRREERRWVVYIMLTHRTTICHRLVPIIREENEKNSKRNAKLKATTRNMGPCRLATAQYGKQEAAETCTNHQSPTSRPGWAHTHKSHASGIDSPATQRGVFARPTSMLNSQVQYECCDGDVLCLNHRLTIK